jgi:putative hydrolase
MRQLAHAHGATHDPSSAHPSSPPHPSVATLLELDAVYRRRAEAGELPTITPRRFNPEGKRWLPILHADREGFHFTLLYSNTARAHELGKTRDWVVAFFAREGEEDQYTLVTEYHGPLKDYRVVRGREHECAEYYGVSQ